MTRARCGFGWAGDFDKTDVGTHVAPEWSPRRCVVNQSRAADDANVNPMPVYAAR
jgi:hypothetical protein